MGAPSPATAYRDPSDSFILSNWLIGLVFLVFGVLLPLVKVARKNRLGLISGLFGRRTSIKDYES